MSKKLDTVKMITETILLYKSKPRQTKEVILTIQKLQQQLDSGLRSNERFYHLYLSNYFTRSQK